MSETKWVIKTLPPSTWYSHQLSVVLHPAPNSKKYPSVSVPVDTVCPHTAPLLLIDLCFPHQALAAFPPAGQSKY